MKAFVSSSVLAQLDRISRYYLYLKPQSTTRGLDNWDQAMILVQQALSSIEFDEMATIYVSHQAGTPAISSAHHKPIAIT